MPLYEEEDDLIHKIKRSEFCPEIMNRTWTACKEVFEVLEQMDHEEHQDNQTIIDDCIGNLNYSIAEMVSMRDILYQYARYFKVLHNMENSKF